MRNWVVAIMVTLMVGCTIQSPSVPDESKVKKGGNCFDFSYTLASGITGTVSHEKIDRMYLNSTYCDVFMKDGGELEVMANGGNGVCQKIAVPCEGQ